MEDVSKKIRFLLQTRGIPYKQAADWVGLTDEHFRDIVDGNERPTPRIVRSLAELCHVKPEFFGGKEELAPGTGAAAGEGRAESPPHKGALTFKDLAVRVQALTECLVDKGIISSADLKKKTEEVTARAQERLSLQPLRRKRKRAKTPQR